MPRSSYDVPLDAPFRASDAIARGAITRAQLRAPRFRRLFEDVWLSADVLLDHRLLVDAAALMLPPGAVVAGRTALLLFGVDILKTVQPVEILKPRGLALRSRPGLLVRDGRFDSDDVSEIGGIPVLRPLRATYDLLRQPDPYEALVAVDAVRRAGLVTVEQLVGYAEPRPGDRWVTRVPLIARASDPRAESPGESRMRGLFVFGRLPVPEPQVEVTLPSGRLVARLDLGAREIKTGFEYDGRAIHELRWQADLERQERLTDLGWSIYRLVARDVQPRNRTATQARLAMALAAGRRRLSPGDVGESDPPRRALG